MLNKIKNKAFILKLAGLVDIYNNFSVIVSQLQIVNVLPFERLDNFREKHEHMKKMIDTIHDHTKCDNKCLWPVMHKDKDAIIKGKFLYLFTRIIINI